MQDHFKKIKARLDLIIRSHFPLILPFVRYMSSTPHLRATNFSHASFGQNLWITNASLKRRDGRGN